MDKRGSFPGVKRAELVADHLPPSSADVKECAEIYVYSLNMPSRLGAQLKITARTNLPFAFEAMVI
jgi:hypothetical protein